MPDTEHLHPNHPDHPVQVERGAQHQAAKDGQLAAENRAREKGRDHQPVAGHGRQDVEHER